MSEDPGLFDVIYHCRAMRRLKPEPVPEELLLKLIDAANQAPSASNRQNARWLIVRDPAQKAKLAEINRLAHERVRQSQPAAAAATTPERTTMTAGEWQQAHLQDVPALIFACIDLGAQREDDFLAGSRAGGSVWPGIQNLLLAARALGLGATPTTRVLRERGAVREALGLPDHVEAICMIPVGYPMGRFGPVTRRPIAEIVSWDRWS
jgi:nitroreductase